MQFMQQSFAAEHQSLVTAAGTDPFKPVSAFRSEYETKLEAGVTLGLYTTEQAAELSESFRSDVARTHFNSLVELDPFSARAILENDPESTHMTSDELKDAAKLVDSKVRDVKVVLVENA